MQVKVADGIKGLVPSMHLADVTLKQPEKKYSIGHEVRCRVRAARQGLQLLYTLVLSIQQLDWSGSGRHAF